MSKVIVSPESSFAIDSSMFVVSGSYESGYEYDEEVFFVLGLTKDRDYCFLEASSELSSWRNKVLRYCHELELQVDYSSTLTYNQQYFIVTVNGKNRCIEGDIFSGVRYTLENFKFLASLFYKYPSMSSEDIEYIYKNSLWLDSNPF